MSELANIGPVPAKLAYSVAEAAKAMSVSTRTVNRWIEHGEVRAALVGGRRLIPATELEALLTPKSSAA